MRKPSRYFPPCRDLLGTHEWRDIIEHHHYTVSRIVPREWRRHHGEVNLAALARDRHFLRTQILAVTSGLVDGNRQWPEIRRSQDRGDRLSGHSLLDPQ